MEWKKLGLMKVTRRDEKNDCLEVTKLSLFHYYL